MKYHYNTSDFGPDEVTVSNSNNFSGSTDNFVRTDDIKSIKENICYIDNTVQGNREIADERIEKLQKELQEFKKDTNKFLRHLIDTSITLSVAIVFILILIIFYNK
jgi:hypothetical protein